MAYRLNKYQKLWLEALESGEYQQATEALISDGGYCCLGVFCSIAGMSDEEIDNASMDCGGQLPKWLMKKAKLRTTGGDTEAKLSGFPYIGLIEANDSGVPFKEIASAIRANPENFFV